MTPEDPLGQDGVRTPRVIKHLSCANSSSRWMMSPLHLYCGIHFGTEAPLWTNDSEKGQCYTTSLLWGPGLSAGQSF